MRSYYFKNFITVSLEGNFCLLSFLEISYITLRNLCCYLKIRNITDFCDYRACRNLLSCFYRRGKNTSTDWSGYRAVYIVASCIGRVDIGNYLTLFYRGTE